MKIKKNTPDISKHGGVHKDLKKWGASRRIVYIHELYNRFFEKDFSRFEVKSVNFFKTAGGEVDPDFEKMIKMKNYI